jgi:lipid-A-disaccharide synthase
LAQHGIAAIYVGHPLYMSFQAAALMQRALQAIKIKVPALPLLKSRTVAVAACGLGDAVTVVDGQSHAVLAASCR